MESRENSSHREPLLQMISWLSLSTSFLIHSLTALLFLLYLFKSVKYQHEMCKQSCRPFHTPVNFFSLPTQTRLSQHPFTPHFDSISIEVLTNSNQQSIPDEAHRFFYIQRNPFSKVLLLQQDCLDFVPQQLLKVSSLLNMSSVTFHIYSWVFVMP